MRMPGIDGATLLKYVKDRFPSTVRLLLSGQSGREALVRAMPAIHQLFSKPCDGKLLREVIDGKTALDMVPQNEVLWSVIGRCDQVPSPPPIYFELVRLLANPVATITNATDLISRDPAMVAKMLQLVNSAYFGAGRATSSIEQAVRLIGLEPIKYIALTASIFGVLEHEPIAGLSLEATQNAALPAATFAAKLVDPRLRDATFAGALLRDLGHTVLATGVTSMYKAIADRVSATGELLIAVEREVLGVTHAEVGAAMLTIWGIPPTIVDAIRFHHDPGSAPVHVREIASAIHVADCLLGTPYIGRPALRDGIDLESLGRAGVADRVDAWCALVAN